MENEMENEIATKKKIYKLQNIDKIVESNRLYKLNNYEYIHEPFICHCGSIYTRNHKNRHFKTKKHIKFE